MSIFISYRRSDDAVGYANQLSTTLRRHFGDDQVFRDITSIPPGADFEDHLHAILASCKVMLVVIGRRWLAEPGRGGGPNRLFDPGDWVRTELSVALDRGIMLIPVIVAGAELPSADALPEPLQGLLRRQPQVLDDRHWDADIRQLVDHLSSAGGIPRQASAPGGDDRPAGPPAEAGTGPGDEAADAEPAGAGGFFQRLPDRVQWLAKLVVGLTALVGAIVGGYASLTDPGGEPPDPPVPVPVPTEAGEAVIEGYRDRQGEKPTCYKGQHDHFAYLPFSLHPTLKDSPAARKHLYWFRFWGQNDCDYPLDIVIKFRSKLREPIVEYEPAQFSGRIEEGEKFDRRMHPGFEFPRGDVDDTLQVEWEIVGKNGRLDSGEEEIVVLRKGQLVWDLPSPGSDGIDPAFLLAGLSAWAIPNSDLVQQRAGELRAALDLGADPFDVVTAFVGSAYEGVFQGSPPEIRLSPSAHPFPPPGNPYGSRPIRPAHALFEARSADRLEAALLLSSLTWAITREKGVSLVLFAISEPGSVPRFLLAWQAPGQWAGIDTGTIADTSFEENESRTTAEIESLLAERPEVAAALQSDSVFFQRGDPVIAVDLTRAATRHGIKHLP